MTNTEPTAPQVWILAGLRGALGEREVVLKSDYDCLTSALQVERERAEKEKRERVAITELMNCYNVGGWTDAVGPMLRAQQAEAERDKLRAALAALKEQVEADKRDAKRYRWLRDVATCTVRTSIVDNPDDFYMDAAIDRARSQS